MENPYLPDSPRYAAWEARFGAGALPTAAPVAATSPSPPSPLPAAAPAPEADEEPAPEPPESRETILARWIEAAPSPSSRLALEKAQASGASLEEASSAAFQAIVKNREDSLVEEAVAKALGRKPANKKE